VFVAMYLVLGIGALVAPVPADGTQRLDRFLVLAIGVSAFALSSVLLGGRIPVAHGVEVVAVNSLAAVCEEAFFRRLAYGWLVRGGAIVAIGGSALLFALVHVPLYGAAVFWVDLGAGLVLSWQRWASGSWGMSAATHVWANLLAVAR
jgi:membrane protease YdiL (CAAX protease family)